MKTSFAILMFSCASLSACATVDIANMASPENVKTANVEQVNSVKRLASKLYTTFHDEGWAYNPKQKRSQSTASVLLNGLQAPANVTVSVETNSSTIDRASLDSLSKDVRRAEHHIFQVTKAAEAYLTLVDEGENLRRELASLEKALLASRQAEQKFTRKFTSANFETHEDMTEYSESVTALRAVTDVYGERVRSTRTFLDKFAF
ncbi:MAG: hypothetical protein ACPGVT_11695 [Maricaulaceae bacterium]